MFARLTRRRMLYQTSLGAAVVGLAPAATRLAAAEPPAAIQPALAETEATAAAMAEPLVAYLHPNVPGELSLLVGTREIIVQDADLIARLINAAR